MRSSTAAALYVSRAPKRQKQWTKCPFDEFCMSGPAVDDAVFVSGGEAGK